MSGLVDIFPRVPVFSHVCRRRQEPAEPQRVPVLTQPHVQVVPIRYVSYDPRYRAKANETFINDVTQIGGGGSDFVAPVRKALSKRV